MIRKATKEDNTDIKKFISRDYARNYFIALGLLDAEKIFKDIYIEIKNYKIVAALFLRKSGNLQFSSIDCYDVSGFRELIGSLEFNLLISPRSFCLALETSLEVVSEGAFISSVSMQTFIDSVLNNKVKRLSTRDLDGVVEIYKKTFFSYPNKKLMKEKLLILRGRGVAIITNKKIVSVAQTEFETEDACVVVGVATDIDNQGNGYASDCLTALLREVISENKMVYLQYDNLNAGRIYERFGFKIIDQVYHYRLLSKS